MATELVEDFGDQPCPCCAHHFILVIQGFVSTRYMPAVAEQPKIKTSSFLDRCPCLGWSMAHRDEAHGSTQSSQSCEGSLTIAGAKDAIEAETERNEDFRRSCDSSLPVSHGLS